MATQFTLSLDAARNKAPADLKPQFKAITDILPEKERFFADSNWKGTTKSIWQVKTSLKNYSKLVAAVPTPINKTNDSLTIDISGYKVKFKVSGKTAGGGMADAKTTEMQELGSVWIMRRAIRDNYKYNSWEDIVNDPKFHELVKIYPDIVGNIDWLQGYYAQQKRMLKEFSGTNFTEFNRDGGFMKFISDLVRTKFGISKKDTWNPADIWLLSDNRVISEIKKSLEGSKMSQTVAELNAILRKMFIERRVVGISLKKISGKVARYEEFNVEPTGLNENYNYEVVLTKCDLEFKGKAFATQEARVDVAGKSVRYNFTVKGNTSSKWSNLKFEPTQKGAASAKVGKAPLDMVQALMKDNKMKFDNSHKLYPKTADDFTKEKSKWIKVITTLKTAKVDLGKNTNPEDIFANILEGFASGPKGAVIANSKLMQLSFLVELVKLDTKSRNEFMTDMVFIAAKKGDSFGPFGKLY